MISTRCRSNAVGLWLLALLSCPLASLPLTAAAELPKVIKPLTLTGWVSPMWEPVASVGGLLDEDDLVDVALVLHRHDELPTDDPLPRGSRALAIFSLDEQGDYIRVALAETLLPCVDCLGTLSRDPASNPFDIEITDRLLTVGWLSNEHGLVSVRLTFAWSPEHQTYLLVRDDIAYADRTHEILSRRTRDLVAGTETLNGQTHEIAPRVIPIGEVRAQDYQ